MTRPLVTAVTALLTAAAVRAETFVYVSFAAEKRIAVYRLDGATGRLTHRCDCKVADGEPGALTLDPDKRFLLAAVRSTGKTAGGHSPIERVAVLTKARVPVLLIRGDEDKVMPLKENSAEFAARYKAQGAGEIVKLIFAKVQGHNYWEGSFRCQELIDFTIAQAQAGKEGKGKGKD